MEERLAQLERELNEIKKAVFKLPLDPSGIGALNQAFLPNNFDKFNVTNLHLKTGNEIEPSVNGQVVYNENAGTPHIQAMIDDVVVDLDGAAGGTPGTPVDSVQFNSPLGTFAGSTNMVFTPTGGVGGNGMLTINEALELGDSTGGGLANIHSVDGVGADGEDINIITGNGDTGNRGGDIQIRCGDGSGDGGGDIYMAGGDNVMDSIRTGFPVEVFIDGGYNTGDGGWFSVEGGGSKGEAEGGSVMLVGGATTSGLGSQLITNGSFTGSASGWTLGTGWAYNSNNVLHTAGNTADLSQSISITDGLTYRVILTVGGTAGSVDVKVGSTSTPQTVAAATTNATLYFTAGVGVADLTITPTSNFDGTIDTVSVVEISHGGNGGDIILEPGETAGTLSTTKNGKIILVNTNNLKSYRIVGSVSTTDATPTSMNYKDAITLSSDTSVMIEARVIARRTGGSGGSAIDSAGYVRHATYKNIAGTVSLVGSVDADYTAEDQAGWDCSFAISGDTVYLQVTGATNNNITWVYDLLYIII